jgi:hypothetical protein
MRVGCRSIVVLSVVACACVPSIPPLPRDGGPSWLELKTEHVTLWTDAPSRDGRELVREVERRRELILAAMPGRAANLGTAARTHIVAVVLRDWFEAGEYGASTAWTASGAMGQPGLLICADDKRRNYAVNHELAHVFSRVMAPHQPPWLSEGNALYFEGLEPTADGTGAVFGAPTGEAGYLRNRYPTRAADVLGCFDDHCQDHAFRATSWAMFSYLANHHPAALDRYRVRFAELSRDVDARAWYDVGYDTRARLAEARKHAREQARGRADQAWRDVFPELPPDELDGKLRNWLLDGKLRIFQVAARESQIAITERPLGETEVLAIRGWMGLSFTDDLESGRANIDAALARDRTNVLARLVHASMTHAIALDDARATVAAHPDDWRALRLVELALHGTPEGDQTLDRLCAMSSNTAPECLRRTPSRAVSGE